MSQPVGVGEGNVVREVADRDLTDAEQRILENEELCARQDPKKDWRGNVIDESAPKSTKSKSKSKPAPVDPPADPE